MIETLFLDAGGVLVFPNFARISESLAQHGVHVDAAALAAAEPRAKRRLDVVGTIQATDDEQRGWLYFNLILTEAGLALSDATSRALADLRAYHGVHNLWEHVPEDVPVALDRLRALGLRLVVVSNANGTLEVLLERVGLLRRFHTALDSHRVGIEKPDPRLFELALARAGARPETTVHVGDLYHVDVLGARAAGLRAVLLDAAGLYDTSDCPRVRTLGQLADSIEAGAI